MIYLLAAEFVILSSFQPRHAAPPFAINPATDATTWLVRDHKRHRELVNAYQGGSR